MFAVATPSGQFPDDDNPMPGDQALWYSNASTQQRSDVNDSGRQQYNRDDGQLYNVCVTKRQHTGSHQQYNNGNVRQQSYPDDAIQAVQQYNRQRLTHTSGRASSYATTTVMYATMPAVVCRRRQQWMTTTSANPSTTPTACYCTSTCAHQ
jgi:hypothetical protein